MAIEDYEAVRDSNDKQQEKWCNENITELKLQQLSKERLIEIIKKYLIVGIGKKGLSNDSFVMEKALTNVEAEKLVEELGMTQFYVNSDYYKFYKIGGEE